MHVLDIVLKHHAATFSKTIGQAVFSSDDLSKHKPLGREPTDTELWLGHRQSIVLTDMGPMLQARDRPPSPPPAPFPPPAALPLLPGTHRPPHPSPPRSTWRRRRCSPPSTSSASSR